MQSIQVFGSPIVGTHGGHEYVVRKISEGLANYGFRVIVLCPTTDSKLAHHQMNRVEYVGVPSFKLHPRAYLPKLSSLRLIVQALKGQIKCVHVHCPDNVFVFIIALICKILDRRVVATVLSYADDFKHHDKIKRLAGLFTSIQQTLVVWIADKVHVEGPYDQCKLRIYGEKVVRIPPGIEDFVLEGEPALETIVKLKNRINYHNGDKIALFIGRVHKAKGLAHALHAIGILNKKANNIKLVVTGPNAGALEQVEELTGKLEMKNRFIYLGPVSEEEKVALIDLADIIVIPSLSDVVEAYSLVASEAWARRKPVVAYAVGALKYRIRNGINGYTAVPGDPEDLAKKILAALDKKPNLPDDVWAWNEVVEAFRDLYF